MRSLSKVRAGLKSGTRQRGPLTLAALMLVVLLVAACGQAASTAEPTAQPTVAAQATVAPTEEPTTAPEDADVPAGITPAVTVADQAIVGGMVTIAQVVSSGPGWLVVHADNEGSPGPVLGYSPVVEGENADVAVMIDTAQATETLYAMLHNDAGTVGTFEFPGPDGPVLAGGEMVSPAFSVTGGLAAGPTAEPTAAATDAPTTEPTMAATAAPTAEPTAAGGSTGAVAADEGEVELEDFQFQPQVLTVKVGTEVKFANKDDVTHTVTSDSGLFDSGPLQKGDEFFYTFTEAGEFPYYCMPHGGPGGVGMSGTIIVVP